jgi:hypothetical protein
MKENQIYYYLGFLVSGRYGVAVIRRAVVFVILEQ